MVIQLDDVDNGNDDSQHLMSDCYYISEITLNILCLYHI